MPPTNVRAQASGTTAISVSWSAASDNVGVAGYRVWLNVFRVADTTELQVTVPWFNDGSRQQVVQVRAIDTAGNQSDEAPARVVERPSASPAPTPTASVSPSDPTPSTASPTAAVQTAGDAPSTDAALKDGGAE